MSEASRLDIDFTDYIRPGDRVFISEAAGSPVALVDALIEQRHALGGVTVFLGYDIHSRFTAEHADVLRFESYGALGGTGALSKAGCLEVLPVSLAQMSNAILAGQFRCDVALLSGALRDGVYGFGLSCMLMGAAAATARHVIIECNAAMPASGGAFISRDRVSRVVESDYPILEVAGRPSDVAQQIAEHAAAYIGDGATLQLGIGAIADAIPSRLLDRRDLGLHSGMIGDSLVELAQAGVLTNARKSMRPGIGVASMAVGTRKTYDFVHQNPDLEIHPVAVTHGEAQFQKRLVSINGAMEVGLTGEVNAETAGRHYLGAVGGQPDFVRAAQIAQGGRSIIALASRRKDGGSRIVAGPLANVTTTRGDVDIIITEYGAAELRGQPLAERVRRLVNIAHPDHREALESGFRGV
ncbi:acetyl-CoA hydrolase/transferase family protein [Maricaulis salignorans]|uniref:acetyl-CoA hydrolase/transferase family protein n=1 Tax=Maricaulis salignorans TaxID=144026 RepID=UPI003A939C38